MFSVKHINKNIITITTNIFFNLNQMKDEINLWYKICQTFMLYEYKPEKLDVKSEIFLKI